MLPEPTISKPLTAQPGPELFERIKAGDQPAFGTLVRHYQSYAFALAMRFLWDRTEAEDVEIETPASPEDRLDNKQLATTIARLVEYLPRKQRLVFTLRDMQDLSMEEVAAVTGMSPGTVKANLCYARQRMRKLLGPTQRP